MATLDSFRPQVQAEVPACPLFVVDNALRDACRTLARDSWAIRADITVPTVVGNQSYALTPPANHEILGVQSVTMDGAITLTPYMGANATLRTIQSNGTPQFFWYRSGSLWVYPTPVDVRSLVIEAVIRPTRTTSAVDDRFQEYEEAIGYWALYRLKSASGQLWTDPLGARFNYTRYKSLVGAYRTAMDTGSTAGSRRAATNFF